MNTMNPKPVIISEEEFMALQMMSEDILNDSNSDFPSLLDEIINNEDSFVIQASDKEGNELDDFIVVNVENQQAMRFINVHSDERCSFLIPYHIIEEILLLMKSPPEQPSVLN